MWTQGAAALALGYVLHWAFSPPLHTRFYYTTISNLPVNPLTKNPVNQDMTNLPVNPLTR